MQSRRTLATLGFATALTMALVLVSPALATPESSAPAASRFVDVVVVLDAPVGPGASVAAEAAARRHGVEIGFVYEHALAGFSGRVPEGRLEGLRRDPRVRSVEPDLEVTVASQQVPTGVERVFAATNPAIPTDGTSGGAAVDATVAVLDTGVDASHPDLHVVASWDCTRTTGNGPPWARTAVCATGGTDRDGHGTHVAGTVAARDDGAGVVGVAPGARIWSVKVLGDDGSGTIGGVIAGVDLVTANAGAIDVANMSLSASGSHTALDTAISASVDAGVTYVVAAGNSARDVANETPAGHPKALTVAALADYDGKPGGLASPTCRNSGADDTFATFSNFGAGVDLVAPGVCIRSTAPAGGYATMSGTSMAAPHVAGAAALFASTGMGETDVRSAVLGATNTDWTPRAGTTDRLLDVRGVEPRLVGGEPGGGSPSPEPEEPEPDDPGAGDPPAPDELRLSAVSTNLGGGQWRGTVTAAGVADGTAVSFTYRSQRGATGTGSCTVTGGACSYAFSLPNRDGWADVTGTAGGGLTASVRVSKP
jgi:subtilisin